MGFFLANVEEQGIIGNHLEEEDPNPPTCSPQHVNYHPYHLFDDHFWLQASFCFKSPNLHIAEDICIKYLSTTAITTANNRGMEIIIRRPK